MSLFDTRHIKPMLIGEEQPAFNNPDWIYELKLDGERAIVYLDKSCTDLRNKRDRNMMSVFPELAEINKQAKKPCILDGEYIVMKDSKPNFHEVQKRSLMSNPFKIKLAADSLPVSFVAFDILNYNRKDVYTLPLIERKALLQKAISESDKMAISRCIDGIGLPLYELTEQQGLEGIVAKRKQSQYFFDKRTKDWIKCKNLQDDDYVICGYVVKPNHVAVLILGQYDNKELLYTGSVHIGVNNNDFKKILELPRNKKPTVIDKSHEDVIWVQPQLVCTVEFMEKSIKGGMRQPVFKAIRYDKEIQQCILK